jgi:uncharacterized protein
MSYFYTINRILFFLLIGNCCFAQDPDADKITRNVIANLRSGNFDSVFAVFNGEMTRKISPDEIDLMWNGLIENYDSVVTAGDPSVNRRDTLVLTETRIEFAKKTLNLQLSINRSGQVCGLFFKKINPEHIPPAYINTLAFYEMKIPVPVPGIESEGVLSIPKGEGQFPLVIIVGGSGPTGKDGTLYSNKPYKDLAWALAAKGIAVYRYDKRTANPTNIDKKHVDDFTMHDEYAIDLKHIITAFAKDKRIDNKRIFIAGHSQGGFMLPYFAKTCPKVRGYIGLAANFSTLLEMLPYQFDYLSDSSSRPYFNNMIAQCAYMSSNLNNKNYNKDSCMPGLTMAYMRHMEKNKPAELASVLNNKPVLLLQGGRDYQVPPSELELWKKQLEHSKKFEWKLFPKLNHLMMEGEGKPGPAEYNIPANVPEYVPDEIAAWVFKQ